MEKEYTGGFFCNGETWELPLNTFSFIKKKWNTSINNCRTRDHVSADGNVHIQLSGRKWRFGVIRRGALNISELPPEILQSIHLTTWCSSNPFLPYYYLCCDCNHLCKMPYFYHCKLFEYTSGIQLLPLQKHYLVAFLGLW